MTDIEGAAIGGGIAGSGFALGALPQLEAVAIEILESVFYNR